MGAIGCLCIFVFFRGQGMVWVQALRYSFGPLVFSALIAECIRPDNCFSKRLLIRFFEQRFLVLAGILSYGLYVWHPFVFNFASSHSTDFWTKFLMAWGGTLVCAVVGYFIIERPFLRMRSFFNYK